MGFSALSRSLRCIAGVCEHKQDVLALFILESVSDFLVLNRVIRFKGDFPLVNRGSPHPSWEHERNVHEGAQRIDRGLLMGGSFRFRRVYGTVYGLQSPAAVR